MNQRPRILIGIPCYGNVVPEVLEDYMRFMFHCGRRLPHYDFFLGIRTKSEQFRARNLIVEEAQRVNADWLLMLDDDMVVNPHVTGGPTASYDLIEKLIAHDKDIVGALYYQRTGACLPVAMTKVGERGYRFLRDDELTGKLQRVDVAGGGCLLVRMSVFDRLPHPFFAPEHEYGTDVQLCRAAAAKGTTVWLDSGIELGHVRDERIIITRHNKTRFAMDQTLSGDIKQQVVTSDVYSSLIEDACRFTGYAGLDGLTRMANNFMKQKTLEPYASMPDAEWYTMFPQERVARQVWYNTLNDHKRAMTEFILGTINDSIKTDILDFGCGIGIPAFTFAKRGHRVTACDLKDTGTLEFLKWRAKKHGVSLTVVESTGGIPALGGDEYGAIIAMDCLEHIPEWRRTLDELVSRLKPGGVLFCNNGILDDQTHPEHYPMDMREFTKYCIDLDLMPFSSIGFMKRELRTVEV